MLHAQCDVLDISFKGEACIQEKIEITNSTVQAGFYEWDFCAKDLHNTPSGQMLIASSYFDKANTIKIINYEGNFYGFSIGSFSKRITRLDFGADLSNEPAIIDLGAYAEFNLPQDLDFIYENGVWYALVVNTNGNNLTLLDFGEGIESFPTATNISVAELSAPYNLDIIESSINKYVFVSNDGTTEVSRIDFGTSILNTPLSTTNFPITGGNDIRGLALIKDCDNWYGLVISQFNKRTYKLSFGTDLSNSPTVDELVLGIGTTTMSLIYEGGSFYAFFQAINGEIVKIDFAESMANTGEIANLGNFGLSTNVRGMTLASANSSWHLFSIDLAGRALQRFDFPDDCTVQNVIYTDGVPSEFSYGTEGRKYITTMLESTDGNVYYNLDSIDISTNISPDINFSFGETLCAGSIKEFTSINLSGGVTSYSWDFGDAQTSTDPNPSHTYAAAGEYEVELQVQSENGCNNFTRQTIKIYDEPVPDFTLPSGTICTNEGYTFVNNTLDTFDGYLTYEWQVDGQTVSTSPELNYTFLTGGNKEVKLITSIPGCSVEQVQTLTDVAEGAVPFFSAKPDCLSAPIVFDNQSTGGESYTWDFGDGSTSAEANPSHIFEVAGIYGVQLSVTNTAGCVTTTQNQVEVFPMPLASFSHDYSCSGAITAFTDESLVEATSNIVAWEWTTEDGATYTTQNPEHVFEMSDKFDVTLRVVTENGCEATVTNTISVSPSPVADFIIEEHCIGDAFVFSDASTTVDGGSITNYFWEIDGSFYTENTVELVLDEARSYDLELTVKANNNCYDSESKSIEVFPLPVVDFDIVNQCLGESTVFVENSTLFSDEITTWEWRIDGAKVGDSQLLNYDFITEGAHSVMLGITTGKGCNVMSQEEIIEIYTQPLADFEQSMLYGEPPLNVHFTNLSEGAATYLWDFGGLGISAEQNPEFVFDELGVHTVSLTAINAFGCDTTVTNEVYVVNPAPDIELLEVSEISEGEFVFMIKNGGNFPVSGFSVSMDLGNTLELKESFSVPLLPGEIKNYPLNFTISDLRNLGYLCFELELEDIAYHETNVLNNQKCITLAGDNVEIISIYPNPAREQLNIPFIADIGEAVYVQITDVKGDVVLAQNYTTTFDGMNTLQLDLATLLHGVYILKIQIGDESQTHRIMLE